MRKPEGFGRISAIAEQNEVFHRGLFSMDDETTQIYARLTAHEFLLEVLYAQLWGGTSAADADEAAGNINRLMRQAYVAPDADPGDLDEALRIGQDAQALAERFLEKVTSQAAQIREQRSRVRDSQ